MRYGFAIGVFAVMLGGAGATRAETLPVEGTYAANVDAPSRVRSIALADFAGRGGERLAFAIDSALRAAIIEGRPYYDLTFTAPAFGESYTYDGAAEAGRGGRAGAEAVMRGIADVTWRDVDSGTKEVEECVARNGVGSCTEKKKVTYPCRARELTLRPEVRLVAREGDLLYAKGDTLTLSRRFCQDEKVTPPVDQMVEELAGRFALSVRRDIAPQFLREDVRLLETRSGIAKADHAAFKEGLRLTKTDIGAACDAFAALEAGNPQDITILFNIGLCHESAGNLPEAGRHYEAVLAVRRGKLEAVEGLERIASRLRAERQLAAHAGRERGD